MSTDSTYRRLVRRETHSSRAGIAITIAVLLILVLAWLGTESVLAAVGSAPLLLAPADAASATLDAASAPAGALVAVGGRGAVGVGAALGAAATVGVGSGGMVAVGATVGVGAVAVWVAIRLAATAAAAVLVGGDAGEGEHWVAGEAELPLG